MNLTDREVWAYMLQDIAEKSVYIPAAALVGIAGFAVLKAWLRLKNRTLRRPWLWISWFVYLPLLLILTIFEREPGSRQGVSLVLFETFGSARMNSFVIENVLLFIPFGCLAAGTVRPMRFLPLSAAAGAVCSLCIETVQLLTGRGFFQVDDILLNAIGMGVGCVCFGLFRSRKDEGSAARGGNQR